jgi:pimeloyl-ACP methyl ester carboxylesterase
MGETRRRWSAGVLALGLVAAACSGGGGDSDGLDLDLGQGETVVQFDAADALRLGGTLAMPEGAGNGPVGAVLIVPSMARNDRDGYVEVIPADFIYEDLSRAITAAGLAAFRYDRRGTGASRLEPGQQVTFEDSVTDSHEALLFLAQRSGIDATKLAIVGHDLGGIAALRVAATDDKVKGVVLISTPGRPLVEVLAAGFEASHGRESADAFRAVVATLLATGSLPDRSTIRPEHQTVLPGGNDDLLREQFSLDPVPEAAKVKAPTLVMTGRQSALVGPADGERLTGVLPAGRAFTAESTATFQKVTAALPQAVDPNAHQSHGGGRPPDTAERDQAAVSQLTAFLTATLGAGRG